MNFFFSVVSSLPLPPILPSLPLPPLSPSVLPLLPLSFSSDPMTSSVKNILTLSSSIRGTQSHSRALTNQLVDRLKSKYTTATFVDRDLAAPTTPHLDGLAIAARFGALDAKQTETVQKWSSECIKELLAADTLVIGLPVYNFNVSSYLKSWIDNVVVKGITFEREDGKEPVGLLKTNKVYILKSSSSVFTTTEGIEKDFAEKYLVFLLSFLGISKDKITVIRHEGAFSPKSTLEAAKKEIDNLAL